MKSCPTKNASDELKTGRTREVSHSGVAIRAFRRKKAHMSGVVSAGNSETLEDAFANNIFQGVVRAWLLVSL